MNSNQIQSTERGEALRIIIRMVGDGGVQSFLKSRQPALGDRTGGDLLQNDPCELLKRLRWLEADAQSFHDEELVSDPCVERHAKPLKKSRGNKVLELLDELDRSWHE
jgi:hypothetical protein